jgi:hypothetical protein
MTLLPDSYMHPKSRPWVFGLLFLLSVSLLGVPIVEKTPNALAFETFYNAGVHWLSGLDPYAAYEGFDYYKLSPTFLMPLMALAQVPFVVSGVIWQALSIVLFFVAMAWLLRELPLTRTLGVGLSLFLPFLLLTDFQLNGTYLQSNTLVVAVMTLGLLFYARGQWLIAALLLAWIANTKLYPLVLTLLLFLDLRWRFMVATLISHAVLVVLPYLVWGQAQATLLYSHWFDLLVMDKTLTYGEPWGHFFLGLKPFLEVNFGWVLQQSYGVVLLLSAAMVALPALWLRWNNGAFSKDSLMLLLVTALTWILLFSTRTEGPTLVLIAPVYAYSLWWMMRVNSTVWRTTGLVLLVLTFVLTSLSTSDLFRGTMVHELSWQHNLRTIGLMLSFAFTSGLLWITSLQATAINDILGESRAS